METASKGCGTDAKVSALETQQTAQDQVLKEKYETLLRDHPDGILEVNIHGEIVNANPACERITGFSTPRLLEMTMGELFQTINWDSETDSEMTDCGPGEHLLLHRSGSSICVEYKSIPIEVHRKVIGAHVILRDATQEKVAQHELEYAKEQIQTIFDTLDVALWSQVWPSKEVIQVSPGSEKIWGIPIETILSDPSKCYDNIHPEDVGKVRENMKTLEQGEQFIGDYRVIHPNGEVRWIHDRIIPILNADGNLRRLIGLAIDITQQKAAEEERARTRKIIERSEKLNSLGQLAAGIAHEIRNPLTSLMGFVQLIKSGTGGYQDYFEIMSSELERINTIIQEFLVLSKPHSETMKKHDLIKMLNTTITFLRGQSVMNNTTIVMNVSKLPLVFCDQNQLKQVFINILRNAMDAMPNGGTVTIDAKQEADEEVVIRISDEGMGIPPEWVERVGEPFFTSKENGTGLGMMVTRQIIDNHGGKLEIESAVDEGTCIAITLPIASESCLD